MWGSSEPAYDAATGIGIGRRATQEDALIADFPEGDVGGFVALADGMGGHAAGDVASAIVVARALETLKLRACGFDHGHGAIPDALRAAASRGNDELRRHIRDRPRRRGMGATLLALVVRGDRLHWMSIGDSPLLLLRRGRLRRLNEIHSRAPEIDRMVREGRISAEAGRTHPDRHGLTSVVMGQAISRFDCPSAPVTLNEGDILVAASDGIESLDAEAIRRLLHRVRRRSSGTIVRRILRALEKLDDPDQDNISLAVIRINRIVATATDMETVS